MENDKRKNPNRQAAFVAFAQGYGSMFSMFSTSDYEKYIKNDNANLYKILQKVGGYLYRAMGQIKKEDGIFKQ